MGPKDKECNLTDLYAGVARADGCSIGRDSGQVAVWPAADVWV